MTAATTKPTPSRQLAALDELLAHVELALLDAEASASEAAVARRSYAAKLSREDAEVARIQLALLTGLHAQLEAEREGAR